MGWSGCHEVRSDDQGRQQAAFELSSERAIMNILCLGLIWFPWDDWVTVVHELWRWWRKWVYIKTYDILRDSIGYIRLKSSKPLMVESSNIQITLGRRRWSQLEYILCRMMKSAWGFNGLGGVDLNIISSPLPKFSSNFQFSRSSPKHLNNILYIIQNAVSSHICPLRASDGLSLHHHPLYLATSVLSP